MSRELSPGLDTHKVAAARLWATHHFPYLAAAIFATQTLPSDELGSVVVDRWWRIHADPLVVGSCSVAELGGELVHLISHLLRDHATRGDAAMLQSEAELHHWVDAVDAEINDDYPSGLARISAAVTPEALGATAHRMAEDYYRSGDVREGQLNDCGSGAHGQVAHWEPPPPNEHSGGLSEHDQELVRQRVAADIATDPGLAGAGLRDWASRRLRPTIDWRVELGSVIRRAVATTSGAVDYSYARPSRRAAAVPDVVMASMRQPSLEIAVVIDTSASVSGALLGAAVNEVDGLLSSIGVRSVRFISCDDTVHSSVVVSHTADVELLGGGGTDMRAGIAAAFEARPRPHVVVVLTDGYTPWPTTEPPAEIIAGLLHGDNVMARPDVPWWAHVVEIRS